MVLLLLITFFFPPVCQVVGEGGLSFFYMLRQDDVGVGVGVDADADADALPTDLQPVKEFLTNALHRKAQVTYIEQEYMIHRYIELSDCGVVIFESILFLFLYLFSSTSYTFSSISSSLLLMSYI